MKKMPIDDLCRQVQKHLNKYLQKYTQNQSIKEDAIQEGLVKLWEMIEEDRVKGNRHLKKMEHYIDAVQAVAYRSIKKEQEYQKNEVSGLDVEWEINKSIYPRKSPTAHDIEKRRNNEGDTDL